MRRRKFKRPLTPPPTRHIIVISFLLFVLISLVSIIVVNNKIKPVLIDIAETKTTAIANMAMGVAVNKNLNDDLETGDLVKIQTNDDGDIVHYRINGAVENKVGRNIQYRIENFLRQVEKGNIPETSAPLNVELDPEMQKSIDQLLEDDPTLLNIPLGQAIGMPLLANLGPKIPVKLQMVGSVSVEVQTEVEGIKINNISVKPSAHITVEIQTTIPFATEKIRVEQNIPLGEQGFMGDVPYYYAPGAGGDLSVPVDPLQ